MNELTWFKSSYSDNTGGDCIEVALTWRKSSYSDPGGGECVEVATASAIHIRDSKRPDAESVTVSPTTWASFLSRLAAV